MATESENSSVVVETPELIYRYQPSDESGRPLGGEQVIKYKTQDELIQKFQEQNVLLVRKLRQETRKNRLGIVDDEEISADAPRFSDPVEFKPRVLSADERVALSRDLLDPERFEQASTAFFEAAIGAKPEVVRNTLNKTQEDLLRLQAARESDAWVANNKEYYPCRENYEAITSWMVRHSLAPVRENFQKAYDTLKAANVLVQRQVEVPVVVVPEPVKLPEVIEQVPVIVIEEPPVRRIPTGLTREQASDGTPPPRPTGSDIVYEQVIGNQKKTYVGLAAINAMPSDEYKRRLLTDPNFSKAIEKLETESAAARQRTR